MYKHKKYKSYYEAIEAKDEEAQREFEAAADQGYEIFIT